MMASRQKRLLLAAADAVPAGSAEEFVARQLALGKTPNRLLQEKSPYLLQHAFNPVDWYPWGEEAFRRAREEDKPIFLSIGYATCHWCHVMEEESFENMEIAALLNRNFICIKVDREERPDLDALYMQAVQMYSGSGGWPMSVFLTPALKPFFGGTYFPPESRFGKPGFDQLLQRISEIWNTDREMVLSQADAVIQAIAKDEQPVSSQGVPANVCEKGYANLVGQYDEQYGGFGKAPKFPRPVVLNFLHQVGIRAQHKKGLEISFSTLRKMAGGGVYDHIGGGFHRYSVDERWRTPHFEKMLYDQALLAAAHVEAFQLSGDDFFARVARETCDYVLREMTDDQGGFYSALDADSPDPENVGKKREGAFYTWKNAEINQLLGNDAVLFSYVYGVLPQGNAYADHQGEFNNLNILYRAHSVEEAAERFTLSPQEVKTRLSAVRNILYDKRSGRPRPYLDDKILTDWNGLMISSLARASQVLEEDRYRLAAENAAVFLSENLFDPHVNMLRRSFRKGTGSSEAVLTDYAFFVQGLLDLYESTFASRWLQLAVQLTERQLELFSDSAGGFFDDSGRDPSVLVRMKSAYEGAIPNGNSVAALNLLRLAQVTNNQHWHELAGKTVAAFAGRLIASPDAMPQLLMAFERSRTKAKQIVIAGKKDADDTRALLRMVHSRYQSNSILLLADGRDSQQFLAKTLPFIKNIQPIDGRATAFVCEDFSCKMPTSDPVVFKEFL